VIGLPTIVHDLKDGFIPDEDQGLVFAFTEAQQACIWRHDETATTSGGCRPQ